MKKKINFKFKLNFDTARLFAKISGDKNKIHYDKNFARKTKYKKPIAHGAHLIAIMSRVAGMDIPGANSIINSYEINFKKPIFLPSTLDVRANLISNNKVVVKFFDNTSSVLYAEGYYIFSLSSKSSKKSKKSEKISKNNKSKKTFISGASGEMGIALSREIKSAIPLSLKGGYYYHSLNRKIKKFKIKNIILCGWPSPDNQNILSENNTENLINFYVKKPLEDIIKIAKLFYRFGCKNSKLILIGSSFSKAGRHNFKYPYYSLGKNMLNILNEIISLELGKKEMASVVLEFDIIDGGMNSSLSETNKNQAEDRVPRGVIPNMEEVIKQIKWIINNKSNLMNGSTIKLTGGSLP